MSENFIDPAVLAHLIDVGQTEDFARLESLWSAGQLPRQGDLMRLRPQSWFEVANRLPVEEVVALIKALTLAEKILPDWKAGSVSPVIWLYRKLMEHDATTASLFDWVRAHTDNPFLPDGKFH